MRLPLLSATVGTLLLALAAKPAAAQSRYTGNWAVLPEVQAELPLNGNDYVFVGISLISQEYSGGLDVYSGQLRLGYEHFWKPNWSWGATLRAVPDGNSRYGDGDYLGLPGNIIPGVLLRHRAPLGPLNFSQRLGVEYGIQTGNTLDSQSRAHARLRLGLDHEFTVGATVKLRPRVAYEALAYLRFQRDEDQLKERFVDFGNLRGEVGVRLSPRFDLTPWVASQTRYINALVQFDKNGNPVSGGKVNLLTPTVGLDVRVTLGRHALDADRQPLPTQH
ncbi:hypothetical protein [Hymenobacter psychrophilus]|uniref:Outer membrane protein beta-barrel domain-containing protein n=1 Tax=Hymenobacter psychrophilus TaxID=651662 RepID=A0A1H3KJX1_9BACT|nr:hypothetical protein [Hymenobacter psychrophilus]SDY52512.1 hypothetical protein SAMN04488069_109167 [Hymenobacter psychrophilus]